MAENLNVLGNSSSSSGTNTSSNTESEKPQLCRIVVDESIEKQIVLDELSAPNVTDNKETNERDNKNVAGREFPVIKINDYSISHNEITKFTISISNRIPTMSLSFTSQGTAFKSHNPIKDGDICSVFAATKSDTYSSLRMDFVITSGSPKNVDGGEKVSLTGKLFIPGFDADATYGLVGTSKEVFLESAKRFGLGFAVDDTENTNDKQLWICSNKDCESFLNDVISHTWKDETSFFDWWIDPFYNLNFINVNKMLLENEGKLDITAMTSAMGGAYEDKEDYSQEATKAGVKLLSNLPELSRGVFQIEKCDLQNNSTSITMEDGVEIKTNEFLHNAHIYENNEEPNLILSNVPAYNTNLTEDHIVLRGRAEYSKETNPSTDSAKANYNYKDIYIRKPWCGVSYVMSDGDSDSNDTNTWSGNVNKNYTRAEFHNRINLNELDKMFINVDMKGFYPQIMRGELVPVAIRLTRAGMQYQNPSEQTGTADPFYNGYYYVDNIIYEYKLDSVKGQKVFHTKLRLKRREWPIPVDYANPNEA